MEKIDSRINDAVVVGGNGAVGSLFCVHLRKLVDQVVALDLPLERAGEGGDVHYICSDVLNLSSKAQDALAKAQLVIVALPEAVALNALEGICASINPQALLVDTLSNKTVYLNALIQNKPPEEIISINPMFAPSLGFTDQSTAVIEVRSGPKANTFLTYLKSWGCRLVFMKADEHDRYTSALQAATHASILAFGMSILKSDYDFNVAVQIMPPPHQAMLALLARILSTDSEVYWDIQSGNPYAREARRNLQTNLIELSHVIENDDYVGFSNILSELKAFMSPEKEEEFSRRCAEMFKSFRTTKNT